MKIVHIEDWFHPEMGYQLSFISKYHAPQNELIIITSDSLLLWNINDSDKIKELDIAFEKANQVKIIRLPIKFARSGKYNIWFYGLKKAIKKINPDLIFVHGFETITSFRILFSYVSQKYKICSDTHTLLNQFNNTFSSKIYLFFIKHLLAKRANKRNIKIFSTTQENKNILINIYKIKPELVYESAIGTDSKQYYYDEMQGSALRKSLHINEDEKVILYTGKFNQTKQPHLIIEAFKIIETNINSPVTLLYVGSKNEAYFRQTFNHHWKNKNIKTIILPSVQSSDLYKYYSMAYIGVFPKENTLSALDAQACKLPVVMEANNTNNERLKEGGLTYVPNDISDLANQILLLLNDEALKIQLSRKGYAYIVKKYNYFQIVKEMEEVLTSI